MNTGTPDGAARVTIRGIPPVQDHAAEGLLRYRLTDAVDQFLERCQLAELALLVSTGETAPVATHRVEDPEKDQEVMSIEDRASHYVPTDPEYTFDFIVLPEKTTEQLMLAVSTVRLSPLLFDEWGLRDIEPHPASALSLHGHPGTGKTATAHAIAHLLGKKILASKYSQLESKYHGEGPKNLDALFYAARRQDAVLFIDEADSLMSRRFEVTSHGSEQAVNAMRSELLMQLDTFQGLVIFASNLVQSYDPAFDTRVRHVHFPDPDHAARAAIWRNHLPSKLPTADDVDVDKLADIDGLCGREIRRAVIDAATATAIAGRSKVAQDDLADAACEALQSKAAARATPAYEDSSEAAGLPAAVPVPATPDLTESVRGAT
jgi:ATP-dependent 26S proteasome regulatory subunit